MINLSRIKTARTREEVNSIVDEIINENHSIDNPIKLSDLLVDINDAIPVLEYLGIEDKKASYGNQALWTLKCLVDENGKEVKPGDTIEVEMSVNLRNERNGIYYTMDEMKVAVRTGRFRDKFMNVMKFEVDEFGCIKVDFRIAVHLLQKWGIHYNSSAPISNKTEKTAIGDKKYKYNWRFREAIDSDFTKPEPAKKTAKKADKKGE